MQAHDLFDQGLEEVKFNNIKVPINVAYDRAVAYVEAGKGNWRRTNMKIQDAGFAFQLSCATCHKHFSMKNRAELEFVGPRVHSLSKCSRHGTWQEADQHLC
jgi:hypothetical protein